jgi:hypothetical protein
LYRVISVLTIERETASSSIRTARVYDLTTLKPTAELSEIVDHVDVRLPSSVTAIAVCAKRHARFVVATASTLVVCVVERTSSKLTTIRARHSLCFCAEKSRSKRAMRVRELYSVASASLYPIRHVALCSPLLAYAAGPDFALLSVALSCDVDDPHTTLTMKLTNSGFVASPPPSSSSSSSSQPLAATDQQPLLSQIVRFDADGLPTDCIDTARLRLGRTFDKLLALAQPTSSATATSSSSADESSSSSSSSDAARVVGTILGPVDCLVHQCTLSNDDVYDDDVDDDEIHNDGAGTTRSKLSLICTPHLMIYRQFDVASIDAERQDAVVNSIQVRCFCV